MNEHLIMVVSSMIFKFNMLLDLENLWISLKMKQRGNKVRLFFHICKISNYVLSRGEFFLGYSCPICLFVYEVLGAVISPHLDVLF